MFHFIWKISRLLVQEDARLVEPNVELRPGLDVRKNLSQLRAPGRQRGKTSWYRGGGGGG